VTLVWIWKLDRSGTSGIARRVPGAAAGQIATASEVEDETPKLIAGGPPMFMLCDGIVSLPIFLFVSQPCERLLPLGSGFPPAECDASGNAIAQWLRIDHSSPHASCDA
jgi:hypothetical protein